MSSTALLAPVKAVFLYMDGTIYHGSKLYPTTMPFLEFLKEHNIKYTFCTNNSSRSKSDYVKHLAKFGLQVSEDDFYTSVDFLIDVLREEYPAVKKLFVLGVPSMQQELAENGFEIVDENPDANIVSFDKTLTYERLCRAAWFLQSGVLSFSTHPDVFCPTDQPTVLVDSGAISRCVEIACGDQHKLIQLGGLNLILTVQCSDNLVLHLQDSPALKPFHDGVGSGILPAKTFPTNLHKLRAADRLMFPEDQTEAIFALVNLRCFHV